ncbi:DUF6318 family protein [Arthrobacter sp. Marseille-P9274]|uniref:DUF6318 family protein n=1 Tax=Arthrobacter sp. Marseille-P9274 TaxID=2866572 RepID=UPI0021C6D25F|nr:DUF6318 family protein [Arthrobacter sp. Marseille-P9274]
MFLTDARPRARRLAASALLAAAALALTACGGDAEGQPDPTASPAPSAAAETPAPTPTATPSYKPASADGPAENVPLPKMPKDAKEKTHAGLESFARHWYALLNYAYESGDVEPIRAITSAKCARCEEVFKGIEDWNMAKSWTVGGRVEVLEVSTNFTANSSEIYQLPVQIRHSAAVNYEGGTKVSNDPATAASIDLLMAKHVRAGWKVEDIGVVRPES